MDRDDDFGGDLSFDTSASRAKAVRHAGERLNFYDDMVADGVDPDIAAILLKIGGNPPSVLRSLRKALLAHSGIDSVSKFSIAAIRELPIRIVDPNAPALAEDADVVATQTVLYGYVSPTNDGGTRYATAREVVFQDLLRALWTSINADHERDGLPALTGVADIDFAAYDTSYADFRLCVYSFLSFATVGTGEQLLSCAKSDVEGLRKACRQEKARERKLAEKGIDNDVLLSLAAQLRKATDYKLPASQIANSQGCGYLFAVAFKRYFFVDAKSGPDNLKPLADRKNNVLGECVSYLTSYALLSTLASDWKCDP